MRRSEPRRQLTRGRFLIGLAALFATACLGGSNAATPTSRATGLSATPRADSTRRPRATPTTTPTEPPPPSLQLSGPAVRQGSFLTALVTAPTAARVTADFLGQQYPLGQRIPGGFWGIMGVDALAEPVPSAIVLALQDGEGGPLEPLRQTVRVLDGGFATEDIELPPGQGALLAPEVVQQELAQLAAAYAIFTPRQRWEGLFIQPAQGRITSTYGTRRRYNGGPVSGYHHGLDIANDPGTPVLAANHGRVVFVGEMKLRGNAVIIDHGFGIFSGYNHMLEAGVTLGEDVRKGQQIGKMGTTGLSTGTHLHWEIAVRGVTIDPAAWLESAVVLPTPTLPPAPSGTPLP